uniref:Putative ovule protein n=1 Tax=Solanum chacoense TaxID=4108 RepID=A0A0V0GYE3_SOLCH
MAAGRHGGYRDNEFRGREAEFEVSRRELGYSKGITKELGLRIGILIGIEFMTGVVEIGVG